ncbi:MAG: TMEM165/GDT1 family protein [Actinomycetota bacterium]|nr:TMEM165/GDT1 family protein [Actinomycetota bacterium]
MNLAVMATVFPVIFLGELPDKTMFASLFLAARGRPLAVWAGAALAFLVHVVIAVALGVAVFKLLPHRVVDALVAAMFLAAAFYAFAIRNQRVGTAGGAAPLTALRTAGTATGVIFLAEWGDLTQILTANLAARFHSPLSVGVGAVLALWVVAALAVIGGASLLRVISMRALRLATAVVLAILAIYSAVTAVLG